MKAPTVAPAASAGNGSLHPWCAWTAGGTFLVGWLIVALVEGYGSPASTGTGFGRLWVLMLVLAVAGCLSLPGLVMVLSRASRYAGSLWLAFWGGLAVGVVFGVALWFV